MKADVLDAENCEEQNRFVNPVPVECEYLENLILSAKVELAR